MQSGLSVVGFEVRDADVGGVVIDPSVDGVLLGDLLGVDLVGILLGSTTAVPHVLADLLGRGSVWGRAGYAQLQTCGCGIPDDDLLAAEVVVDDDTVIWRDFQRQSDPPTTHRTPGPFTFARGPYEDAVVRACDEATTLLAASGRDRRRRRWRD